VALPHQLIGGPGNRALCPAVVLGRHALKEGPTWAMRMASS
jgi:hypothetical protein